MGSTASQTSSNFTNGPDPTAHSLIMRMNIGNDLLIMICLYSSTPDCVLMESHNSFAHGPTLVKSRWYSMLAETPVEALIWSYMFSSRFPRMTVVISRKTQPRQKMSD